MSLKWKQHVDGGSFAPQERLMKIGDSIYCSAAHKDLFNKSESGIIEFCTNLDKIINITEYPDDIKPTMQCCVSYKNDIYIIDGENWEIISFDTSSKTFTKKETIPKIGAYPSAVIIFDEIHIVHGERNTKQHLIYNITQDNVQIIEQKCERLIVIPMIVYNEKMIKFDGQKGLHISSKIVKDKKYDNVHAHDKIVWTMKPEWKLPKAVVCCGYILYRRYMIIFGGIVDDDVFLDSIYLLDLEKSEGWKNWSMFNVQ